MKNSNKKIQFVMLFVSILVSGFINAQNITGKSTKIVVNGTSPMHDWTMTSATSTFSGTVSGNTITNVKFSTPTKSLKSEKGKMMDNKAYDALKADKVPTITFSGATLNLGKSTLAGKITLAGVTKNVAFPVNVVKTGSNYVISGTENLKFSEFGLETPGFLGVHTGDVVKVSVTINAN